MGGHPPEDVIPMKIESVGKIVGLCFVVFTLCQMYYFLSEAKEQKQPFDDTTYLKDIKIMALNGNTTAAVWYADDLYVMSQRNSWGAAILGVLSSAMVLILLGYGWVTK